jgi:5-methylcytosine-specific restriction enzyme subunit McrC
MESQIPIQNIYYLLCYAWNKLEEGEIVDVSSLESPQLADLFAKVLLGGSRHLIRRGIDRGYIPCGEERATIRGKIAFAPSVRRNLFQQGIAFCEFDELDHNVLHNSTRI